MTLGYGVLIEYKQSVKRRGNMQSNGSERKRRHLWFIVHSTSCLNRYGNSVVVIHEQDNYGSRVKWK